MRSFRIKTYILRLFLVVLALFIANKFVLRPMVLDHDFPSFLQILVLSIPNTFEAVLGMCVVAGQLMVVKLYFSPRFDGIPNLGVYLLATFLAGTYVLTQEFKLHHLGGRNTYDPYDVVASIVGLVGMLLVLWRYGILERRDGSASIAVS